MSRVTWKEWYRRVNAAWPQGDLPALTPEEATRAVRKLYRFGTRRTWRGPVKLTSGIRHTWCRRGVWYVNPADGWRTIVHALSHWCGGGHGAAHARLELRMIKEVQRRGWLDGALQDPERPPIPARDRRAERHAQAAAAVIRWERRVSRATRALAKARRRLRYYARTALPLQAGGQVVTLQA